MNWISLKWLPLWKNNQLLVEIFSPWIICIQFCQFSIFINFFFNSVAFLFLTSIYWILICFQWYYPIQEKWIFFNFHWYIFNPYDIECISIGKDVMVCLCYVHNNIYEVLLFNAKYVIFYRLLTAIPYCGESVSVPVHYPNKGSMSYRTVILDSDSSF